MDQQLLINRIREGAYDETELRTLHENCLRRKAGEDVFDAIETRMRSHHPAAATRLFGARQRGATLLLQKALGRIERSFDLAGNQHGRHVKTGGDEKTGVRYIDRYISYRNDAQQVVELSLIQDTADSEMQACVSRYTVGCKSGHDRRSFAMGRFDEAVALYEQALRELLQPA